LRALGASTPLWQVKSDPAPLPPLLREYRQFRKAHCGVSDWTLRRDIDTAGAFLALLRRRKQPIAQTNLKDVDVFVSKTAVRFSTSTVADTCSSLRAFLRFLHTTGRLVSDLAGGVMRPRFRVSQRPPRTLPWNDVRRILRSIESRESETSRSCCCWLLMDWAPPSARFPDRGYRLDGFGDQVSPSQDPSTSRASAAASGRQGVDRLPSLGTPARAGKRSLVPAKEHAL